MNWTDCCWGAGCRRVQHSAYCAQTDTLFWLWNQTHSMSFRCVGQFCSRTRPHPSLRSHTETVVSLFDSFVPAWRDPLTRFCWMLNLDGDDGDEGLKSSSVTGCLSSSDGCLSSSQSQNSWASSAVKAVIGKTTLLIEEVSWQAGLFHT